MTYRVQFQTDYPNTAYRTKQGLPTGATVKSGACGPFSLANALTNAGIAAVSGLDMCKLAVDCGARTSTGTVMITLLRAAANRYGFEFATTNRNAELVAHLKAGKVAIFNQGNTYPVFSNGGHYVVAAGIKLDGTIIVLDSYWNSTKYSSWPKYHAKRSGQEGVVYSNIAEIGKATADRDPCYYLISEKIKTTTLNSSSTKKEDTEMVEKTKFRINGKDQTLDAITKDGTTYVALRAYNDALGLQTDYKDDVRITDMPGVQISINGEKPLTVAGTNINDGTNVAGVRAVLEAAGYTVGWVNGVVTADK